MSSYGSDSYGDSHSSDDSYESLSMSEGDSDSGSDWTVSSYYSDEETCTSDSSDGED